MQYRYFFTLLTIFMSSCAAANVAFVEEHTPSIDIGHNIVSSSANPALKIRIDTVFTYLGRHDIQIRDVASGERIIFGDIQNGEAKRFFILQYEGFNEGVDEIYRYDLKTSPEVAGYRWRSNAYAFSTTESITDNPGAETDSTVAFLKEHDIDYPEEWMMWRSLTVTTDDRKNELILFYVEDVANTGTSLTEFYNKDGNSTDYWRSLMPALEQRANSSFTLSVPGSDRWKRIPRYFGDGK